MWFELAHHRLFWWLGFCLLTLGLAGGVLVGSVTASYQNKVLPRVRLGSVELGGLTREQAELRLQQAWDSVAASGVPVKAGPYELTLTPIVGSPANSDLTYELIHFDAARNAERAWALGHTGGWWQHWGTPLIVLARKPQLQAEFEVNADQVAAYLKQHLPELEQAPRSARIAIDSAGNISVLPEAPGLALNVPMFVQKLEVVLRPLSAPVPPLEVELTPLEPALNEAQVLSKLSDVRKLMHADDLVFTYEQNSWHASAGTWEHWLEVRPGEQGLEVGLGGPAADEFFATIRETVNRPTQDARLEIAEGRVTTFKPSRQGRVVDEAATLRAAEALLRTGQFEPLPLTVQVTDPTVTTADANSLGITEVIGVGRSNFAGSPKNRRANIHTGAAKLNGIIIKPDEEFSLIAALGDINQATGYLPELVIKGNQTVPEYGGGLCQIGTTTFRAALATGLPIVERRNHSYRVTYYEPAGTDATIYDPKPDFRFKNDTGHAILIQTAIEGDNLVFEFWGTSDQRAVVQTKPVLSNFVAPPPTKLIETEDLPVGTKKCTEKPHVGADAQFTYTVTYPDGRVASEVFKSHYVPWREVCLIGVPKGTLQPTAPAPDAAPGALPSADTLGAQGN